MKTHQNSKNALREYNTSTKKQEHSDKGAVPEMSNSQLDVSI
jgi:hypothetical protein